MWHTASYVVNISASVSPFLKCMVWPVFRATEDHIEIQINICKYEII